MVVPPLRPTPKNFLIHSQQATPLIPISLPHTFPNPPTKQVWANLTRLNGVVHEGVYRLLHQKVRCTEWSPSLSFLCPWCRGPDWGPTHMFVSGCPRSTFPSLTWLSLELFGSAVMTELIHWPPTSPTTPPLLLQVGTTLHTMHTSRAV